ncbi:MAG: 50S ribosomal protein L15 [Mycoplasma sp.]|nr:50S ribosomal protein L15 [Mycoplasma sp.]
MKLHNLKPTKGSREERTRKGRGHAAGKGKTAGKGESGQNKRSGGGVRPGFEGGQNPWFRRLPKRGFKNINHIKYQIVSLDKLNEKFKANDIVTIKELLELKIVRKKDAPIKILNNGKIKIALTVKANAFSEKAKIAIEKAGGKVELVK